MPGPMGETCEGCYYGVVAEDENSRLLGVEARCHHSSRKGDTPVPKDWWCEHFANRKMYRPTLAYKMG